jgi:hypothetical protein
MWDCLFVDLTDVISYYLASRINFQKLYVMCFVWISEQTAIISLYNINWLDFITEIEPFKAQWSLYVPPV